MRQKINNLLKQYDITQKEIADKMGVHIQTLQMYLYGRRRITKDMMEKFHEGIIKLAHDRIGNSMKLKHESQKLIMDMGNRDSIRDM